MNVLVCGGWIRMALIRHIYLKGLSNRPRHCNMVPTGFAHCTLLSLAKPLDCILKAGHQCLLPYFVTFLCLIKTPRSSNQFINWLHWLAGPIRTYLLILAQTTPPPFFFSLKTHSTEPLAAVFAQSRGKWFSQPHRLVPPGNKSPLCQEVGVWLCPVPTPRSLHIWILSHQGRAL